MHDAGGGSALVVRLAVMIEERGQRENLARPIVLLFGRHVRNRLECRFRVAGKQFQQPQAHQLMHLGGRPRSVDELLVQVVDRQFDVLLPIALRIGLSRWLLCRQNTTPVELLPLCTADAGTTRSGRSAAARPTVSSAIAAGVGWATSVASVGARSIGAGMLAGVALANACSIAGSGRMPRGSVSWPTSSEGGSAETTSSALAAVDSSGDFGLATSCS